MLFWIAVSLLALTTHGSPVASWNGASTDTHADGIQPTWISFSFTPTTPFPAATDSIKACSTAFNPSVSPAPVALTGTDTTGCTITALTDANRCLTVSLASCSGTPGTTAVTVNATNAAVFAANPTAGTNVTFNVSTLADTEIPGFGWTSIACTCAHGQPDNNYCPLVSEEACASCNSGYNLSGRVCIGFSPSPTVISSPSPHSPRPSSAVNTAPSLALLLASAAWVLAF